MKIAIISDIHANIFGLKAVLNDLPEVEKILCAGDITGYYPFVNEVIGEMKDRHIVCVKGNHDQYLIDGKAPQSSSEVIKNSVKRTMKLISAPDLNFIKSLPDHIDTTIDGRRAMMFHASPWNYLEQRIYPDYSHFERFSSIIADVLILGHTHYPFVRKIGNLTIVNPGSCGQPRDFNLLSYVLWDTKNDAFKNKRILWNIEEFKKEARVRGTDEKLFEVFNRVKK